MKLRYTTEEVIEKFKEIHKDKYRYEHFVYNGSHTKSIVTCTVHGDFFVTPNKHLLGRGCPECANKKRRQSLSLTDSVYIERCRLIHKGKYHYDKTHLCGGLHNKVIITCPIHGDFKQEANEHLRGHGCPKCGGTKKLTTDECIKKFKILHGEQYIYNKVEYQNSCTKVCIICPEHGEFWQTPHHHLRGIGCASCGRNNISEQKLYEVIKNEFQDALEQYNDTFLTDNGHKQYIDIYIPSKKIGIEYQGRQHFMPISKFGGETEYKKIIERDNKKYLKSKENGLKIFYFSYEKEIPETYIDTIFTNENKLIEQIKKYDNRL